MWIGVSHVQAVWWVIKHFPSKTLQEIFCYSCSVQLRIGMEKDNAWWQHSFVLVLKFPSQTFKSHAVQGCSDDPVTFYKFYQENTFLVPGHISHILSAGAGSLEFLWSQGNENAAGQLLFLQFQNGSISCPLQWFYLKKSLLHGSTRETLRWHPFAVFCDGLTAS